MAWVALTCPQCGAPLPRVAIWRSVTCGSCGSLVTRTESVVTRDTFRQALARASQGAGHSDRGIVCGGQRYNLIQTLGRGESSEVYLAQRLGPLPFLATIKLSSAASAANRYAREAQVLRELQAIGGGAGGYFSQRIPEVLAEGEVEGNKPQHALVLRYPNGFWGSLAALNELYAKGLDPRHVVWIWRRILEMLGFAHSHGWSHGDVQPDHALVHPQDHAVRLIGWASAKKGANAKEQATDLLRSARIALVLLSGTNDAGVVPNHISTDLAQLVTRASQDEDFCRSQRAEGLDTLLRAAAQAAFGPPAFVPLTI